MDYKLRATQLMEVLSEYILSKALAKVAMSDVQSWVQNVA